jgi:hypothetical protein
MAILPKAIYTFTAIPIKIPMTFCTVRKINLEIHMATQKTSNTKTIVSKKSNDGGTTMPDFKLYHRAITKNNSTVLAQKLTGRIWIRTEDPNINPHRYSQQIFDKGAQTHNGEEIEYSTTIAGKTG